jgi:hypothetical protein
MKRFIIYIFFLWSVCFCFAENNRNSALSLNIQSNRQTYIQGEEVWVSLFFKNIGNSPIVFNATVARLMNLKYDSQNHRIILTTEKMGHYYSSYPILRNVDFTTILPGESFLYKRCLSIESSPGINKSVDLEPGIYKISAEYLLPPNIHDQVHDSSGKLVDMSKAWKDTLSSNTIIFEVIKKADKLTTKNGFVLFTALDLRAPLLEQNDIISYNWSNHILRLTDDARKKFKENYLFKRKFIVCVDGIEVYQGTFWSSLSSEGCRGPIIQDFYIDRKLNEDKIYISYNYPVPGSDKKDPRSDKRIYDALKKANKIWE